jgi:hypothetical protein
VREFCPPLLPRVPMAWGSSFTGDRTKGTQDLPLAVTTAGIALDFNASRHGRWSGVGTLEGDWVFWIGDQARCHCLLARPRESGAEVRHWLILVGVYLLD